MNFIVKDEELKHFQKVNRLYDEYELLQKVVLRLLKQVETLERDRKDLWEYVTTNENSRKNEKRIVF
jgi:hypothetical protein